LSLGGCIFHGHGALRKGLPHSPSDANRAATTPWLTIGLLLVGPSHGGYLLSEDFCRNATVQSLGGKNPELMEDRILLGAN